MKAKVYFSKALATASGARRRNLLCLERFVNVSACPSGEQWTAIEVCAHQFGEDLDILELLAVATFINTCHE